MMTQLQPGVQQPLQNVSSQQILINATAASFNTSSVAATASSLPTTPYYRPGIPYHIFQNVVLPAFSNTSGNLKTNELQNTIPPLSLSVTSTTLPQQIIKTELPPVGTVLKTDLSTDFCSQPNQTPQLTHHTTTNIKSEFGSQSAVLSMSAEGGNGNTTVIGGGNINNLLLTAPAHMHPQLLEATQLHPQHQQILLPLPLHLQQTQLPLQEQLLEMNTTQVTTSNDGNTAIKKKKKPKSQPSYKIHNCTQCAYTCNRADKLRVHIMGVHNNDKPFQCDYCEKSFKQRDKLSRHTHTVHFRERPYACDYCPLAFGRKDKVKRHVSTVHLGERPYRCNFCTHKTSRKDKMRIHLQQVHQSLNGAEHFMIDRAPQPPPRVLPGNNTNRNISDIVGIVNAPLPPPPPAALPSVVVSNTVGGMIPSIVNTSAITTFGTTTPSVTLTHVPVNTTCLNIPSTTSSSNTIGSVTLTPVHRSNPKNVTLTPLVVQQQPTYSISNEGHTISTMASTNFITSESNTLTQLNSLSHNGLANISIPSISDSSTITMIANSMPGMNLTTTLNNSLSNTIPSNQIHQNNVMNHGINLPTCLTATLPTLTFPSNFVSHLANPANASIASLSTSTNSLTNSMMHNNLTPTICTTNPVNHTILTNVLNNVGNEATVALPPSSNQGLNQSTTSVQLSHHPHNAVLSTNVIPLMVTKIQENTVH